MELMLLVYLLNVLWVLSLAPILVCLFFLCRFIYELNNNSLSNLKDGGYYELKVGIPELELPAGRTVKLDKYSSNSYLKNAKGDEYRVSNNELHGYLAILGQPITKVSFVLIGALIITAALVPSKETAVYMAGAYMLQEIATDDRTIALGSVAYDATLNQLKVWSQSSPELSALMTQSGLLGTPTETK